MSVLVVVQARTGSSRFPRKVLTDLAGQPMLAVMLDRLITLTEDPERTLVVATSDLACDDEIARVTAGKGLLAVRGSEQDVLARFGQALQAHPADLVVRLTADCPLMDPAIVRQVLSVHESAGADYTSNTLARTWPDGLDVEVMTADSLRWAIDHASASDEREHVTPYLLRHPRSFQFAQAVTAENVGDERWTVDVPEDLEVVRAALAGQDHARVGWEQILASVGRRAAPSRCRVVPIVEESHHRGDPYCRVWSLDLGPDESGRAEVTVDEGGRARLVMSVSSSRSDLARAAVRDRLHADLQVTDLADDAAAWLRRR